MGALQQDPAGGSGDLLKAILTREMQVSTHRKFALGVGALGLVALGGLGLVDVDGHTLLAATGLIAVIPAGLALPCALAHTSIAVRDIAHSPRQYSRDYDHQYYGKEFTSCGGYRLAWRRASWRRRLHAAPLDAVAGSGVCAVLAYLAIVEYRGALLPMVLAILAAGTIAPAIAFFADSAVWNRWGRDLLAARTEIDILALMHSLGYRWMWWCGWTGGEPGIGPDEEEGAVGSDAPRLQGGAGGPPTGAPA